MAAKPAVPQDHLYTRWATLTPSDTTQYGSYASPKTEDINAIYCGSTAALTITGSDGVAVAFAVTAGQIIPVSPVKVNAATTTTPVIALWW
jgi:hypothetical protein